MRTTRAKECGSSGGSGTRGLAQSALDLDAALTRAEQEDLPILLFGHSWGGYAAAAVLSVAVVIAALYRVVGDYLAWVYTSPRDGRVERVLYRVIGVDPQAEQTWQAYTRGVLLFSLAGVVFVYLLLAVGEGRNTEFIYFQF